MSELLAGFGVFIIFILICIIDLKLHMKKWKEDKYLKDSSESTTKKLYK